MLKSIQFIFVILLISVMAYRAAAQPPNFTAYSGNPVVPKGNSGSWDEFAAWAPGVAVVNDSLYLTYNGTSNFPTVPVAIGLSTSSDGFTFAKSNSNPILSADGSGFDAYNVTGGQLFFDNGAWHLYYSGRSMPPNQPGNVIGRATASNPRGPWTTTEDTLLSVGSAGEWDSEFITPASIVESDTGLVMFYWAGNVFPGVGSQIGLATSTDNGLTWQKFDSPTTTTAPYAESDPVLQLGPVGSYDDHAIIGCGVLKTSTQWEMFYAGSDQNSTSICYATSNDGIVWKKDTLNPIFLPSQDPLATAAILEVPAVVLLNDTLFLYYDYGVFVNGIGLASDPEILTSIEPLFGNHSINFELHQNYPNPFNPTTVISWQLAVGSPVKLTVYNLAGQRIATLVNERLPAGYYSTEFDGSLLASGVYLYRLETEEAVLTQKMVMMK